MPLDYEEFRTFALRDVQRRRRRRLFTVIALAVALPVGVLIGVLWKILFDS